MKKQSTLLAIQGIRLHSVGNALFVSIEIEGKWIEVIRDSGSLISHIVEPLGIEAAIQRSRRGHV